MKLAGVMPALVTPFDANGEIDFPAFEKHLTALRAAGVSGWVPCGSSGEYNFMSDAERGSVLRFVKDFAGPDEVLIAGTNAPHTKGVIANTRRAKEIGYDTVLLATPFYTKPTDDELLGHFKAVLDAVDPMVDQGGRAISSRARLDNAAGKLRPGMFVRVRLLFGDRNNVLMVPEQAIVPGAQPTVFKVVEGKATIAKVKLGVRRAAQVEVIDGLAADDLIVTAGQLKLRDGAPVRAIGQGAPAAAGMSGMEGMSGMAPAKAAEAK